MSSVRHPNIIHIYEGNLFILQLDLIIIIINVI